MKEEHTAQRSMPTWLRSALIGTGLAVAAVAVSGFVNSAPASAAESGLLDGLADTVEYSTGTVGDLVGAQPVEQTVTPAANAVDGASAELLSPVLTAVPIVGDDLAGLVDGTATDILVPVAATVDGTLDGVGQVADGAGATVGEIIGEVDDTLAAVPGSGLPLPSAPGVASPSTGSAAIGHGFSAAAAAVVTGFSLTDYLSGSDGAADAASALFESRPAMSWTAPLAPAAPGALSFAAACAAGTASGGPSPLFPGGDIAAQRVEPVLDTSLRDAAVSTAPPASMTYDTDSSPD